jgi:hypothetical protein
VALDNIAVGTGAGLVFFCLSRAEIKMMIKISELRFSTSGLSHIKLPIPGKPASHDIPG